MIEIKTNYPHDHNPSIFIMFDKKYQVHWCYSGNELARIYLEDPSDWISEPLEVPIPEYLDKELTNLYDNW